MRGAAYADDAASLIVPERRWLGSLDEVRRELRERLNELRPLVDEYAQLERAAYALGEGPGEPRAGRRARSRSGGRARVSAPRAGINKQAIYGAIGERPGVSVGEIALVTGVAKPLIYNTTRAGVQKGELRKLDLGGGRSGFALMTSDGG